MATSSFHDYRGAGFITGTSLKVRTRVVELFMKEFPDAMHIADVGVTSENVSPEANVLEALYPHKHRLTALGIEDAEHLESKYPGLKFKKIEAGKPLPFADNAFDVVYTHAVIEHIVQPSDRVFFIKEVLRIGKAAFITTPNKYFPVEVHTFVPLLHVVWPALFYALLDRKILSKFYDSSNLKLISRKELVALAGQFENVPHEVHRVRLFGMTSNWILLFRKNGL